MVTLNEACVYLLENWDIYLEMVKTEDEINKYLIDMVSKIEIEIKNHHEFPKDWIVKSHIDEDIVEIQALPKAWENWNKYGDWLAYVAFDSLNVKNLLSKERDDRAWFGLFLDEELVKRKDPIIKKQAEKLWKSSGEKKYIDQLQEYQWDSEKEYGNESCLFKIIDQIPISMIKNEPELIDYIVSGMITVIQIVDQIKEDYFPKSPESK